MFLNLPILPSELICSFGVPCSRVPQAIDTCVARPHLSCLLLFDPLPPCRNGGRVVGIDLSLEKILTAFSPPKYWQLLHNPPLSPAAASQPLSPGLLLLPNAVLRESPGFPAWQRSSAAPCVLSPLWAAPLRAAHWWWLLLHCFPDIWAPWTPRPSRTSSKFEWFTWGARHWEWDWSRQWILCGEDRQNHCRVEMGTCLVSLPNPPPG